MKEDYYIEKEASDLIIARSNTVGSMTKIGNY
jgi:hypothetical protein